MSMSELFEKTWNALQQGPSAQDSLECAIHRKVDYSWWSQLPQTGTSHMHTISYEELKDLSSHERFALATKVRQKILENKTPVEAEEIALCLSVAALNLQERGAKRPKSRGAPTEAETKNPLEAF